MESDKSRRRLTAQLEAHEASRQAEAGEYERRLRSETAAKAQKQYEIELLASQNADLNARMTMQSEYMELATRRQEESDRQIAALILASSEAREAVMEDASGAEGQDDLQRQTEDYQRQTVTLLRSQQNVDQLSMLLQQSQKIWLTWSLRSRRRQPQQPLLLLMLFLHFLLHRRSQSHGATHQYRQKLLRRPRRLVHR